MCFVSNWSSTLEVNVERDIFCNLFRSLSGKASPGFALPILPGNPSATAYSSKVSRRSLVCIFSLKKKSCLMFIYSLSVMTDPPSMFPYGGIFLSLRRTFSLPPDAVEDPRSSNKFDSTLPWTISSDHLHNLTFVLTHRVPVARK